MSTSAHHGRAVWSTAVSMTGNLSEDVSEYQLMVFTVTSAALCLPAFSTSLSFDLPRLLLSRSGPSIR